MKKNNDAIKCPEDKITYAVICKKFPNPCGAVLYLWKGFGKRLYHDVMEWHMPTDSQGFDGCSFTSTCKYCGKEIMQDSQGNWF